MQRTLRSFSLFILLVCSVVAFSGSAAAAGGNDGNPNNRGELALPVTGTATVPGGGRGGTAPAAFTGLFHLHHFDLQNGQLVASGVLVGSIATPTGPVTIVRAGVTLPVTLPPTPIASCDTLHLDLDPVTPTLPGGVPLSLDVMPINISAEATVGNPLASLLCSIIGRINAGDFGSALVASLNQLIAILS